MSRTLADLKRGEKGIIKNIAPGVLPIKLFEMGCLPGNEVEVIQYAPFRDPLYININGTYLAIRKETALKIAVDKIEENPVV